MPVVRWRFSHIATSVVSEQEAILYTGIPVILAVRAQGFAGLVHENPNLPVIIKVDADVVRSGVSSGLEGISVCCNSQRRSRTAASEKCSAHRSAASGPAATDEIVPRKAKRAFSVKARSMGVSAGADIVK